MAIKKTVNKTSVFSQTSILVGSFETRLLWPNLINLF